MRQVTIGTVHWRMLLSDFRALQSVYTFVGSGARRCLVFADYFLIPKYWPAMTLA